MSERWQIRRGTTQENDDFTGAEGELTMDTQKKQLRVHDGTTQGGAGVVDPIVAFQVPTANNGYTWYRKYRSGWVEQGGVADYGSAVTDIPKIQVNLPITMSDNRYYATEMPVRNDQDGQSNGLCAAYVGVFDRHTTYFCVRAYCGNTNERIRLIEWEVKGMAA